MCGETRKNVFAFPPTHESFMTRLTLARECDVDIIDDLNPMTMVCGHMATARPKLLVEVIPPASENFLAKFSQLYGVKSSFKSEIYSAR